MLDDNSDGLVAHELAHQWFGDYVTCNDWAHIWLNEGFATFMEAVATEELHGHDRALSEWLRYAQYYFWAEKGQPRALVGHRWKSPEALFDSRPYQKGGWVLRMLRARLGEENFWAGIRLFLNRHPYSGVESFDLRKVLEEVSGISLVGFFDQWVDGYGFPEISTSSEWNSENNVLAFHVEQTQGEKMTFPLVVSVIDQDGKVHSHSLKVEKTSKDVEWEMKSPPRAVLVDPDGILLADISFDGDRHANSGILTQKSFLAPKLRLMKDLRKNEEKWAGEILMKALKDESPEIRRAAALALKDKKEGDIGKTILAHLQKEPDPRVRLALANALHGRKKLKGLAPTMVKIAKTDRSFEVESACLDILASLEAPEGKPLIDWALKQDSYNQQIRRAGMRLISAYQDRSRVKTLKSYLAKNQISWLRTGALSTLGELAEENKKLAKSLRPTFESLFDDSSFWVRMTAVGSYSAVYKDKAAIGFLKSAAEEEPDNRIKMRIDRALEGLEKKDKKKGKKVSKPTPATGVKAAKKKLAALEKRVKALEKALEEEKAKKLPPQKEEE